jgi:hypothetical protein
MTNFTCDQCGVHSEELITTCSTLNSRCPSCYKFCPDCYGKRQGILSDQMDNLVDLGILEEDDRD